MVNRCGRLTGAVYHEDRLPANGRAVSFMDDRTVCVDGARIDDIADATMNAINEMDGDDPSGWAWHPWSRRSSLRPLRGMWGLLGPGRQWYASEERSDEAGLAHLRVTLDVALEMRKPETEDDAEAKADGYTHKYHRGATIEVERLGKWDTLVHIACEHELAEPVLADLRSRLAVRWRKLGGEEDARPTAASARVITVSQSVQMDTPTGKRQLKTTKDRQARVRDLYKDGLTAEQMARDIGCGESTVRKDCRDMGLKLR